MATMMNTSAQVRVSAVVVLLLLFPVGALGQQESAPDLGVEAVEILQSYLRIDTSNPPGREAEAAAFLASHLDALGIPYEIFESGPGRANLYARLSGDGSRGGAVVLLHHMDVVPVDERSWSVDPFSGVVLNEFIYGRGALDSKAFGAVQLVAFLDLHRAGVELGRDIILLATADEEMGGAMGAGHVVKNRPDLLEGAEFVLTEGGGASEVGGRTVHFVEVSQKTPLWLRLRVTGPSGHGAQPLRDSAVNRLIRALERLRVYRGEIRLVPAVAEALRARASYIVDPAVAEAYRNIETSIDDLAFLAALVEELEPLLRNTISITALDGAPSTNVIPDEATAELDCRLLPGEDPYRFIATLSDVIDDPGVQIEPLLVVDAAESRPGTPLWRALEATARAQDPEAILVPNVIAGFTDSHHFRHLGLVAYGWTPFVSSPREGPVHGADERILVANVERGPSILRDLLVRLAAKRVPVASAR
jgi:acetylornithine deacetylase/succinyl-diaminopimelate desuccinylase-like protein